MSNPRFLEVTDASIHSKVLIDVSDISKVRSPWTNDLFAPRNALGAIHLKRKAVQYTTEPYHKIREALADLCEIKSVKEVE